MGGMGGAARVRILIYDTLSQRRIALLGTHILPEHAKLIYDTLRPPHLTIAHTTKKSSEHGKWYTGTKVGVE